MASDNKSLGKFNLDGIPPAPRGVPQIEVTFDIDANGILKVTALDKATSRSQHITITASSGLSETEVEKMRRDAEANAEADRKRKELIEVRNHADNLVYTAEKTLKDYGDKIPAEKKAQTESAAARVRETMNSDDVEAIRKATDELGEVIQQLGASMYQQPGSDGQAQPGETPPPPPGDNPAQDGDDVVDGEFRNA